MAFDFSDVLKGMKTLDEQQQIVYIPLDQIDPDPDNFYSLDGLEELAGSIEMLGLQQPLLLRPTPDGRYIVISGHRRREALLLIQKGGSQQFANGVPCIVDASVASKALQELKLIMANSDIRKMSSSDQNKQAERIEDLLRQLEDEGFEFPGRLRDWVAKLSGMSRSKLARLKVIRDKLDKPLLQKYYDKGKLNEATAYELAQLPVDVQRAVVDYQVIHDRKPEYWGASTVKQYAGDLKRVAGYTCPAKFGGQPCVNQGPIMEKVWKNGYHGYCHCAEGKKCCATCSELASCSYVCVHMQPKAEELRKEKRQKNKELKEAEKAAQQPLVDRIRAIWLRFGNALSRANMEDEDLRKITGHKIYQLDAAQIAALEAGEYAPKIKAGCVLPFYNAGYLSEFNIYLKTAEALDCSLDYLFCRTDVPEVNTAQTSEATKDAAPTWQTGDPPAPGWYCCWAKWNPDGGNWDPDHETLYWSGAWFEDEHAAARCDTGDYHVFSWYPVPAPPEKG